MLGIVLLFVGIVLINNGLVTLFKMDKKAGAYLNIMVGFISVYANFLTMAQASANADYYAAGTGLLFGVTYLFVGCNWLFEWQDLRPYGFYSLFVAINAVVFAIYEFPVDWRMGVIWFLWAALWATGFIEPVLKKDLGKFTPYFQVFCGIVTAWIPGLMMLTNVW